MEFFIPSINNYVYENEKDAFKCSELSTTLKSKVDKPFCSNFLRNICDWRYCSEVVHCLMRQLPLAASLFQTEPSWMESEIPFYVNSCTKQT